MQPIFITGGSGFIGSHIRSLLAAQKVPVINLDLEIPKAAARTEVTIIGDIRNPQDLESIFTKFREIRAVIHLAAIVSVPECENNPDETAKTNVQGTANVVEALRAGARKGVPLIFASSAAVYGDGTKGSLKESEAKPSPVSHYGRHKLAGEEALQISGVPWAALRIFNVYGEGQNPGSPYSGVITRFADRLKKNEKLEIHGDGSHTRDFVAVSDVARAFSLAAHYPFKAESRIPHVFNTGSGHAVSVRQLGDLMKSLTGSTSVLENTAPRVGDIAHSCADISQIQSVLKWSPQISLKDGLSQLLR